MKPLSFLVVRDYVSNHIVDFHQRRIWSIEKLTLEKLLRKNPYLFRAKNINTAHELISGLLEAFLSSSEEKLFGDFLEGLAIFIAQQTCDGHKSSAAGVDLEFINKGVHYIISIKSGPNWGNSSQQSKLELDLQKALARLRQLDRNVNVQAVLGICYGNTKTSFLRGYMKVVGQNFWFLISENPNLFTDIIEPIGYHAREHNEQFALERDALINRLTKQFIDRFCYENGNIHWDLLVQWNSGNLEIER